MMMIMSSGMMSLLKHFSFISAQSKLNHPSPSDFPLTWKYTPQMNAQKMIVLSGGQLSGYAIVVFFEPMVNHCPTPVCVFWFRNSCCDGDCWMMNPLGCCGTTIVQHHNSDPFSSSGSCCAAGSATCGPPEGESRRLQGEGMKEA